MLGSSNEYVSTLGRDFTETPKTVYAAIALSFAMRLTGDDWNAAKALLANEWETLHANGILPQKPRKAAR